MRNLRSFIHAMHIFHLKALSIVLTIFLFKIASSLIDDEIFLIFVGKNHTDTQKMRSGDDFKSIKFTNYYDNKKPSVMYIHGWQGKFERRGSQGLIDAYLTRGDHNFIFVDWSKHAKQWNYAKAARGMNEVRIKISS